MEFNYEVPEWLEKGVRPSATALSRGWQPGESPPAEWHNWFQHLTYMALLELKNNAANQESVDLAFKAIERMMMLFEIASKGTFDTEFFLNLTNGFSENASILSDATVLSTPVSVGETNFVIEDNDLEEGMQLTIFDDVNQEDVYITTISGDNIVVTPLTKAYKKGAVLCRSTSYFADGELKGREYQIYNIVSEGV